MAPRKKFKYLPFQVLLSLLGGVVIYIGYLQPSTLIQTIGGTIFGASLGTIFAAPASIELSEQLMDVFIGNTENYEMDSVDEINNLRKNWIFYCVSRSKKEYYWVSFHIDFDKSPGKRRLLTRIKIGEKGRKAEYYLAEGIYRKRRFILSLYPEEAGSIEPAMVAIFDVVDNNGPYTGTCYLMTWDRSHMISAAIISSEPLVSDVREILIEKDSENLDKYWCDDVTSRMDIFPKVGVFTPKYSNED